MREEVMVELSKRIENLRRAATPGDMSTGMSGSFVLFNYYLQSHTAMTQQEFDDCVYDRWLQEKHKQVYEEVNKQPW